MTGRRRTSIATVAGLIALTVLAGCERPAPPARPATTRPAAVKRPARPPVAGGPRRARSYRVVHVLVALCDNANQGIVRVPASLGDGQDPANNLYWGAMYGVKTFFRRSAHWTTVPGVARPDDPAILDRVVFRSASSSPRVFVVADAYDGAQMKLALQDFFAVAAGGKTLELSLPGGGLQAGGWADLVCFVGHNGLMDARAGRTPRRGGPGGPEGAIVLACKSTGYFSGPLKMASCPLLVGTTGLMAPEAYTLDAALRSWAASESPSDVRRAAAAAYAKYQKCSIRAARRLFAATE